MASILSRPQCVNRTNDSPSLWMEWMTHAPDTDSQMEQGHNCMTWRSTVQHFTSGPGIHFSNTFFPHNSNSRENFISLQFHFWQWHQHKFHNILNRTAVMSCTKFCNDHFTRNWMKANDLLIPVLLQAPVPLSIFRSNSKFDENSKHSSVKYARPITTIFCTRHDSVTVVTCAKYRCDRLSIFETRAFCIFIEFRIRSKYA